MLRSLFRTIFWIVALLAVAVGGFRLAADQRERFRAEDLLPENGGFTETTHGRLHAIDIGPKDGPAVLLIHGAFTWSGMWQGTMQALANEGYRAIALDLPPMGLSDRDNFTEYSRQAQGLRILAFIEAKGIRPTIVAHSFGAGAAAEAMLAAPEAFEGAVLVSGVLTLGQDGTGQEIPWPFGSEILREIAAANSVTNPHLTGPLLTRLVHRNEAITDELVARVNHPFMRQGTTDTIARWAPTLFVPPRGAASTRPESFQSLALPVALIWGREDQITPPDQAIQLQAALGEAPLFWIADVGHMPQIEAPTQFNAILSEALALVGARTAIPEN